VRHWIGRHSESLDLVEIGGLEFANSGPGGVDLGLNARKLLLDHDLSLLDHPLIVSAVGLEGLDFGLARGLLFHRNLDLLHRLIGFLLFLGENLFLPTGLLRQLIYRFLRLL
jgi:hypothetical protein